MKYKISIFLFSLCVVAFAKVEKPDSTGFDFTVVKDIATTSVKNQYRSGTCWSFSGISYLESEAMRLGKDSLNLSEMFVVRKCYEYKAEKFVRMQGTINFGPGGAFMDVFWVYANFGMMPDSQYLGLSYGEEKHVHGEVDALLKSYVDIVQSNKNKKLSTAWYRGYKAVLDEYFGRIPESFDVNGKSYSPQSFAKEKVGINPDDYVSITSYTHHPFYKPFILEVPDNWIWESSYNLPLNEMMEVVKNAVENGYTIAWGGDVSEKGFSQKNGLALIPEIQPDELTGLEKEKWEKLSENEKQNELFNPSTKEKMITQALRQEAFDNYQTTDDHGMHITGLVKDQNGKLYYKVKNSWSTDSKYQGFLYMSEAFVAYKTMNFVVHKDALPKSIKKKLGI